MRRLPKPTDDARALLVSCASDYSQTRTLVRRQHLLNSAEAVAQAAIAYDAAATTARLHTLPQGDPVAGPGTASREEMIDAYNVKMVKSGSPGRAIYDKLMTLPPGGRCPLCGTRVVSQLDHHLPKTKYPLYALLPTNLIASCTDCNEGKVATVPRRAEEETMHPYYDDYVSDEWLYARVVEEAPPAVLFSVRAPTTWTPLKRARAERHLDVLGLKTLFSVEAANMLAEIRYQLISIGQREGPVGIRHFLKESADSRQAVHLNSWQTATYKALSSSDWFCIIGYSQI